MGNELVMSPLKFTTDRCDDKERLYSLVACLSSGTVTVVLQALAFSNRQVGHTLYLLAVFIDI